MDIFNDIPKNEGLSATAEKRWTLIFIGSHGKTITLNHIKGMVMLACVVVGISLAIAAGLLYFSLNIRQEKKQLESNLKDLKAQINAIRYEKDVLMTKLVLAETRSKARSAESPPKPIEPAAPQQNTNESGKPGPSTHPAKAQKAPLPEKEAEENESEETEAPSPEPLNQSESGLSVALEDFKISPRVDENLLRIQFKIKNTTPNSRRVSGHAIVVLKGEQLTPNQWLSMPRVVLSDGKPTGKQRGYTFGINYFKTMRFKANLPKKLSIYETASVFIFTSQGDLLLEQDFAVNLSAEAPAAASEPPSTTPSAPSKPSSSPTAGEPPPAASDPPTTQPAESSPAAPSPDELMNTLKNSTDE